MFGCYNDKRMLNSLIDVIGNPSFSRKLFNFTFFIAQISFVNLSIDR